MTGDVNSANMLEELRIVLARKWRAALLLGVLAAALTAVVTLLSAARYSSVLAFTPSSETGTAEALGAIAGSLGFQLPGSERSTSPEFYVELLQSDVVLQAVASATYTITGGSTVFLADLLDVKGDEKRERDAWVARKLRDEVMSISLSRQSGVVRVRAVTEDRAL
jgi:hypothetical protein